jgi:uncharacterized protein
VTDGPAGDIVDTLSNAFTPERQAIWDETIAKSGLKLKIRRESEDGFVDPAGMVARMDELGIATVLIPTCDIGAHGRLDPLDYEHVATRWPEAEAMAATWPGRFAALAVVKPGEGMAAVNEVRARLAEPWVVGMFNHTHSWDRRFDHADLYPYYALGSEFDVPIVMQAGTSGGVMPSECGHPIGIDRPAIYFPETRFVLSHTGWPWVEEAVSMALRFRNVFIGTASYPPRHWAPSLVTFLRGPGRHKVIFASNFPTVGQRKAIDQMKELELDPDTYRALVGGTARTVFPRLVGPQRPEGQQR